MNNNGILEVYHAGTDIVKNPDCKTGRRNLDFGQGFYLTDIYEQALNFARSKSDDRKKPGIINVYLLDKGALLEEAKSVVFDSYDDDWLEFVVACRSGKDIWARYDYVEGGVADDRVINTVNLYIQGYISKERALQNLRYLRSNNQICILSQDLLDRHLRFTDSLKIPE